MAGRAECDQEVEIEVRAPLGALDDVVDLEGAPAAIVCHLQRARRKTICRSTAEVTSMALFRNNHYSPRRSADSGPKEALPPQALKRGRSRWLAREWSQDSQR
jgi:hypothetical protein